MKERKHHWPPEKCYFCGEPAVAGCDGVEHYNGVLIDGVPRISMKDPEAVVWCDRLMCEDHATTMGMTTKSGHVDTIDYCEKHRFKQIHGISPEIKTIMILLLFFLSGCGILDSKMPEEAEKECEEIIITYKYGEDEICVD